MDGSYWLGIYFFMTFHSVGNFIIPTDEVIFFRGVGIPPTDELIFFRGVGIPPTSYDFYIPVI